MALVDRKFEVLLGEVNSLGWKAKTMLILPLLEQLVAAAPDGK